MTRISYRRATPENWELTIRRMMSLNKAQIRSDVARRVIKSLSDSHGLAPEEARPIMFDAERRMVDFTYSADMETNDLCRRCHSMGRVLSERRTRDEWNGLIAMHRYYYPGIDGGSGGFRRGGPPGADARRRARQGCRRRRQGTRGRQRSRRRESAARGSGTCPSHWRLSADVAGMDRVVGRDAHAAAGRPLGARRL